MRKRIVPSVPAPQSPSEEWLDVERLARVETTSEDPAFPIEAALAPDTDGIGAGWRAAEPGEQTIRLFFDEPQRIRRIGLRFVAPDEERTQEFVLRWSADGTSFREIVRQQWNFSPEGATSEVEEFQVDLTEIAVLELKIIPDISGGDARASLAHLRLA